MSLSLVEALSQVDLEPGRTYRCRVKNRLVELRVREVVPPEFLPAPLNESDIMIMLDPWVELPKPKPIGRVVARLAPPPPPDIPEIPPEDEVP